MIEYFQTSFTGSTLLLRFTDAARYIDLKMAYDIDKATMEVIEKHKPKAIVLNLAKVDMMTSRMIGHVVKVKKQLDASGGRLILCNVSEAIRKTISILALDNALECVPTEEEALAAVAPE